MASFDSRLKALRGEIDRVDCSIISLLKERLRLIRDVARLKKAARKPVVDREREQEVISRSKTVCGITGACPVFVENVFSTIIRESRRAERKILKK